MAQASLRLFLFRQFSRSRPSPHVAFSPSIIPTPLHGKPANPSTPWQQFSRLPCLPCRPLVDLQNLGSTGQHDRNAKEVSLSGLEPELATSVWNLQCRRNHINVHIPALYGTSVLYGPSALYGTSAQRPLTARGEASEEPEEGDRETDAENLKSDVAKLYDDVANAKYDKVSHHVAKVTDDVAVSKCDVARVKNILLSLGCTKLQLERLLKKKIVALVKHKHHILRKAEIFRSYGIDSQQFLRALERDSNHRQQILYGTDERHVSILNYFQGTVKLQRPGKLVSALPAILSSLPSSIESKLQLWSNLGVPLTIPMMEKFPGVFTYSEKTIKEGIEGVKAIFPDPLGGVVLSKYPILAFTKPQALEERDDGLRELFGNEVAKRLLAKNPGILIASLSTIQYTYKQLQHLFGEEKGLIMVQRQPALLCLSWDSLGPKLEFLVKEMGRDIEEVGANVLTYSLEKRLKPRYEALIKAKVESGGYALSTIFSPTNKYFEDHFGVSLRRERV